MLYIYSDENKETLVQAHAAPQQINGYRVNCVSSSETLFFSLNSVHFFAELWFVQHLFANRPEQQKKFLGSQLHQSKNRFMV